jgi:hypothetical protein
VTPISLDQLIDYLSENVDFCCQDSILESSSEFGRLYLNKNLIKDHILHGLKNGLHRFEHENKYTPPSLMLYASERFLIRANLWRATEEYSDNDVNLYGLAHDHNFDFLTLSYKGPGYESRMYTYDYKSLKGVIGEPVVLVDNGILNMNEGEMFFYRKNHDVHSQLPPKEDSITINLMASLPKYSHTMQYIFDTKKSVVRKIYGGYYARKHVFDMAALLNDAECNDVMRDIGRKLDCEQSKNHIRSLLSDKNK